MIEILGNEADGAEQTDSPDVGSAIKAKAGSWAAKQAWYKIQNEAYSPESVAKAKKLGFDDAKGLYNGKPLLRGIVDGQGDFEMIKDKLVYAKGFDPASADTVIAKIKAYRLANP